MIIDSHCHLDFPVLYDELESVINRAYKNDVKLFLTICTTLESYKKIKNIVNNYKNVYGTFGIHPHETKKYSDISSDLIIKYKNENTKIVGIGESGLDYFYNHSDKETQKKVFIEHIKAASKLNIPLIVHSRNAETDTYEILREYMKGDKLKVIIHCFTGNKEFAQRLIDIGCYISLSGIITFKNSKDLVEATTIIPIDRLLVETDSPYLAPMPNRGKSNEPSFITHTIEKLSIIKNIDKKIISQKTTNNFKSLFELR